MIAVLLYGISALLFAYLNRFDQRNNFFLFFAFSIIYFFMAFRLDYGNDYRAYEEMFYEISKNYSGYRLGDSRVESGWILLNKLFKPLGFNALVAFTSLISCIGYYLFITKFVNRKYYWISIFIFIFNTNYMLIQLSAMRQSIAIVCFIISLVFLKDKKYFLTVILLIIAYFFHKSALLLIPILLILTIFKFQKINKLIATVLVSLLLVFYLGSSYVAPTMTLIASKLFDEQYYMYLVSENEGILPNIINILTYILLLILLLLYYNRIENKEYRILTILSIIGVFMLPLGFIISQAGRLAFYFLPVTIVIYPYYLKIIDNKLIKILFIIGVIIVFAFRFFTFFNSDTYHLYYYEYNSLLNSIF